MMARRVTRIQIAPWQATLTVALFALGFLIAAQVGSQAPASQRTSLERPGLIQTIQDLQRVHDRLTADISTRRAEIASVREGGQGRQSDLVAINQQLQQAQLAAGFTSIEGPGGYLYVVDGSPPPGSGGNPDDYRVNARDVRILVAALWRSGAEAISINNERVVTSTAILDVGGSILVNSAYVTDGSGQYVISVVGPADVWTRLSSLDTFRSWMETRYGPYRLAMQYAADQKVFMFGYAGSANLRVGRVAASPSPSPQP